MSLDVYFLSAWKVKQFQEIDYKQTGKFYKRPKQNDIWIVQGRDFYSQQNGSSSQTCQSTS